MDFFQAQDAARARTRTLVLLFLAAVAAIIAAVYLVVHLAFLPRGSAVNRQLLLTVAAATTALIASGSIGRTLQLRQGGGRVATLLGGRRVDPNTADELERRYVNVVEEMALASGTPVPAIYVLHREAGINAFAAGYALDDAAVAVTRGTLETLDRDELQGVIAHEFSHILNGDMRLNIRLMGLLYGILLLTVVGRGVLRGAGRGRSRKGGGGQLALVGLGLVIVGYIGVFFGRLIQAAVSRQREYHADAAAVQFTRNPGGIAGALTKIGGLLGSRIENHHAQEASHLFFATGLKQSAASLFATHPPLADRIQRIDATFRGELAAGAAPAARGDAAIAGMAAAGFAPGITSQALGITSAALGITSAALVASVGAPQAKHVAYARQLLASLPPHVYAAAHDRDGAAVLLFAVLLHEPESPATTAAQDSTLRAHGGNALVQRARDLARATAPLGEAPRLPLIDLLLPALSQLSQAELQRVRNSAAALIAADNRVDPFEFTLLHLLDRHVHAAHHNAASAAATKVHSFAAIRTESEIVLSAVAWAGAVSAAAAADAFAAGAASLPRLQGIRLRPQ